MSYAVAFAVTILVIELMRRYSEHIGLLDHPGDHKIHGRSTPAVGGIGILAGLAAGAFWIQTGMAPLVIAGAFLVIVGMLDDINPLSPEVRFFAQVVAVAMMIFWGDVNLQSLGHLLTDSEFLLGRWGVALTIFGAVGVINALNMSDGMDGLAGCLTLMPLAALAIVAYHAGRYEILHTQGTVIACVFGFLCYNLRFKPRAPARVFMGNAGSMLLGLIVAWFLINYSQGDDRLITPVTALWLVALPLFDAVGVILRRARRGASPFKADRIHCHHCLLDLGFSVPKVLVIVLGAAGVLMLFGLSGFYLEIPEFIMFYLFLGSFLAYLVLMDVLGKKLRVTMDETA